MRPEAVVGLVGGKDGHQTLAVLTDEGGSVVLQPALMSPVNSLVLEYYQVEKVTRYKTISTLPAAVRSNCRPSPQRGRSTPLDCPQTSSEENTTLAVCVEVRDDHLEGAEAEDCRPLGVLHPVDGQDGVTNPADAGDHPQLLVGEVRGGDRPGPVVRQPGDQDPHQARDRVPVLGVLVVEVGQQAPVGVDPERGVRLEDGL